MKNKLIDRHINKYYSKANKATSLSETNKFLFMVQALEKLKNDLSQNCPFHESEIKFPNTDDKILELGIEIIAAMKASCYDWNIETGRILALSETEINRMEDITPEDLKNLSAAGLARLKLVANFEKDRLHKQAKYVAKITLEKLKSLSKGSQI